MTVKSAESDYHKEFPSLLSEIFSKISLGARKKMYAAFTENFGEPNSLLDVGVTSADTVPEANYFEKFFPHKNRITAIGIEDASKLESEFPGVKFVKVKPGESYPFENGQFEVAFSNAVIEHITNEQERKKFVKELLRVSKSAFITTPNKYFWVEPHTGVPFLHFLSPNMFYKLLEKGKVSKFYNRNNLKLLDYHELKELGSASGRSYKIEKIRTFGIVSNLILIIK